MNFSLDIESLKKHTFLPLLSVFVLIIGVFSAVVLSQTTQEIRKGAQTTNPVSWSTNYVTLTADDFYIEVEGKRFYGRPDLSKISVKSNPGKPSYTTLETEWTEGSIPMRLYIYFANDGINWWATEIRTYNGQVPGDWVIYNDSSPYFMTSLKGEFSGDILLISDSGFGSLYFKNLKLKAFVNYPDFSKPYTVWPPGGESFNIPVSPSKGTYGLTAMLYDSSKNMISDQSDFEYLWSIGDSSIMSITTDNLCLEGMVEPCPLNYAAVSGISPGSTQIMLSIRQKSTQEVVGQTYWNVSVDENFIEEPGDVHFVTRPVQNGTKVQVTLYWADNSDNEEGFILSWYIEGTNLSSLVVNTPNKTSEVIATLPCASQSKILSIIASVYSFIGEDVSFPAFGEGTIVVPECPATTPVPGDRRADINQDGVVNILDYVIFFENFGKRFY